jgi:hypothetical protein
VDELPDWQPGTAAILSVHGPHAIPVSTATRAAGDPLLFALAAAATAQIGFAVAALSENSDPRRVASARRGHLSPNIGPGPTERPRGAGQLVERVKRRLAA